MNRLFDELQRLYFLQRQQCYRQQTDGNDTPSFIAAGELTADVVAESQAGQGRAAFNLVSEDGLARAMVINFKRSGDWERLASLLQAFQDELDFPLPAVSVSGHQGYHLWFSLAEPISADQAGRFLSALYRRYLAEIPAAAIELLPDTAQAVSSGQGLCELVPALNGQTEKWSAFIDPSLGGMFVDEPGLEMAPSPDKQAAILAGLKSIKAVEFQVVLNLLQASASAAVSEGQGCLKDEAAGQSCASTEGMRHGLSVGNHYSDPKSFLLAVMNDASASPSDRIKAAKALLPYFYKTIDQAD